MQRLAIEPAATARGDVVTDWRSEKRSGKLLARPELDGLRFHVREGTSGSSTSTVSTA
jgi:hypothetical protein